MVSVGPVHEGFCADLPLEGSWWKKAADLVMEVPEDRERAVRELRTRVELLGKELEGLAESSLMQEEAFLVRFLRGANWDVEEAGRLIATSHKMIQDYFPYMSSGPPSALEHVFKRDLIFSPAMRDSDGRRLVLIRLGAWPPNEVPLCDFFTAIFTLFELVVQEDRTQVSGVTMILDCKGFGLSHLRHFNLDIVMCINSFLCGAFPLWFRKIHVVNNPMMFSVFGKLVGPLLNERVKANIIYHNYDIASLHKEVSPSLLPTYLGGEQEEKGLEGAWVVAARSRDAEYTEKIRQAGNMRRRNQEE